MQLALSSPLNLQNPYGYYRSPFLADFQKGGDYKIGVNIFIFVRWLKWRTKRVQGAPYFRIGIC